MIKIFKIKKFRRINKAFTLVETLVAISIFTMAILGLMSVLASSISNTNYAKQKIIAEYLAQEGIEYVRNIRTSEVLYSPLSQSLWKKFSATNSCDSNSNTCGFSATYNSGNFRNGNDIFKCNQNPNNCGLYLGNTTGVYDPDASSGGVYSGFTREIWRETISTNGFKIHSRVSWTQGSGPHNVTFSEDLYNWYQ